MKSILSVLVVSILFGNLALAAGRRGDNYDNYREIVRMKTSKMVDETASSIDLEGRVRCVNDSHFKTGKCNLELVSNEGDVFDVKKNDLLIRRHCKNHKDLLVNVTASKAPQFLFWGGELVVKSFSVEKELDALPQNKLFEHRFEHLEHFNTGISR